MAVLALGISFRRAPIDLLERLAFTDGDLAKAYRHAGELDGIDEAVVLSTCNRVEVYGSVASYHAGFLALKRLLIETRGVAEEQLADGLYAHWERDAIEHLFSVAGGLDSMVLGETQIQSQVREALRLADGEEAAGTQLKGLFHAATRTGRRIRQETSLGAAPDAFVGRGATLAEEVLGGLAGRSVVVIGAGTMASLAVKHLRQRGVGSMHILNRSVTHARALAERTDADHGDLDALPTVLREADLVVSATGAIVSEEDRRCVVRRRGDELAPLIRALRRRGDAVLQGELERQAGRLHDLTPDERAAVEALARGIVAKLLHDPIVALKERSEPGSGRTHAKLLAELLGLDPSLLDGE